MKFCKITGVSISFSSFMYCCTNKDSLKLKWWLVTRCYHCDINSFSSSGNLALLGWWAVHTIPPSSCRCPVWLAGVTHAMIIIWINPLPDSYPWTWSRVCREPEILQGIVPWVSVAGNFYPHATFTPTRPVHCASKKKYILGGAVEQGFSIKNVQWGCLGCNLYECLSWRGKCIELCQVVMRTQHEFLVKLSCLKRFCDQMLSFSLDTHPFSASFGVLVMNCAYADSICHNALYTFNNSRVGRCVWAGN